jgi:hypothetical protein
MTMLVEGLQASDHDDVMQSERAAQFHPESTTQAGAVRTPHGQCRPPTTVGSEFPAIWF